MNIATIKKFIKDGIIRSGYARTAVELQKLSDRQLDDLGISRALLMQGHRAYPWRDGEMAQTVIPDNVSTLTSVKKEAYSSTIQHVTKAA